PPPLPYTTLFRSARDRRAARNALRVELAAADADLVGLALVERRDEGDLAPRVHGGSAVRKAARELVGARDHAAIVGAVLDHELRRRGGARREQDEDREEHTHETRLT